MHTPTESYTGDPSRIVQIFPKFDIQILCCRYWWLKNWEHSRLDFPFWRLYYNYQEGAYMGFNEKNYALDPQTIYLISPNTNYATHLYDHVIPKEGHTLTGASFFNVDEIQRRKLIEEGAISHIFIHFVINYPYTTALPGIYEFPIDDNLKKKINKVRDYLVENNTKFDMSIYYTIQSLICGLLGDLDYRSLVQTSLDGRIVKVMAYIDNHLSESLSNEVLAELACVTPNSFARLFKDELGITVQSYIRQKRVDKACSLFLHSDLSIDQVAMKTGFSNRYHFTRVFREITDTTPAKYKKNYML